MITQKDLDEIENRLSDTFATKSDLQGYKSDIMDKLDDFLDEIKTSREEQIVMSGQISDHEDRITNLESSLNPTQ